MAKLIMIKKNMNEIIMEKPPMVKLAILKINYGYIDYG
jgi:hypothetical protein